MECYKKILYFIFPFIIYHVLDTVCFFLQLAQKESTEVEEALRQELKELKLQYEQVQVCLK